MVLFSLICQPFVTTRTFSKTYNAAAVFLNHCRCHAGDDMEMSGRIKMTFAGGVNAAIDFVNLPSTQRRLFYALDQV